MATERDTLAKKLAYGHPQAELIDDILLATHHGWKHREPEEERRIELAWDRYARRVSLRYRFKFWLWRLRLDYWGVRLGCRFRMTKSTGVECWYDYFEDGLSPKHALEEDWSYA